MIAKKNLADGFAAFQEPWSPRVAGDINDMQIKLVKLGGEFVWHSHDEEDELFLVISGRLRMEFRDQEAQVVGPGEFIIVPHGVSVMLAERALPRNPARLCSWSPARRSIPAMSTMSERFSIAACAATRTGCV